jgi:NAD(P)-dependent dehydrogenase (short-subunit alcohol dehydrogenase family)
VAGLAAERTGLAYALSKCGLHALTRHVANAYGKQNIRCNALALGMILTDQGRHNMTPAMLDLLTGHNALVRLGQPDDIAEMVAFLVSDLARLRTGTVIPLDGGFYVPPAGARRIGETMPGPGGQLALGNAIGYEQRGIRRGW